MNKSKFSASGIALLFILIILLIARLLQPHWDPYVIYNVISWDQLGYYIYLPATFIYHDLFDLNFLPHLTEKYPVIDHYFIAFQADTGNYVFKYPLGLAIFYFPFFIIGHIAALTTAYPADGYSMPYQVAIAFGAIFYAITGLWFLRKFLLKYFPETLTALTLLIIVLGTNYFEYTAFTGAHSHNYLFTLYAIILYCTYKWHKKPSLKYAAGIGIAIGLAILSRPSEIVAIIIPLLWGISGKNSFLEKVILFKKYYRHLLITGLLIFLMFLPQMIYWKMATGNFLFYSYEEQGFSFLHPHFKEVIIGFRKGWLIYTPMMVLSILGFITLFRSFKKIFFPVFIYFIINLWVVSSWDIWWYGGSFGMRALVQSYAVLSLPLASLLLFIRNSILIKYIAGAIITFFAVLNLFQTWQYHNGILLDDHINRRYYFTIFGETTARAEDKYYLSAFEKLENANNYSLELHQILSFEDETENIIDSMAFSGTKAYVLKPNSFTPTITAAVEQIAKGNDTWIRASVYAQDPYNIGSQVELAISFEEYGKPYKWQSIKLNYPTRSEGSWKYFSFENKVPERFKPIDQLKIYVWNLSSKPIIIDDLKSEILTPPK